MLKGKVTYFILGIIFLTAVLLKIFSVENNWLCNNGIWIKHGNPNSPQPTEQCLGAMLENNQKIVSEKKPTPLNPTLNITSIPNVVSTSSPNVISTSTASSLEINSNQEKTQIIIETPQPGTIVSSPLVVRGQAQGNWFFEASLPIKLLDSQGRIIASVPATAEGNWTSNNLIPFSSLLEFITTSTSGYLLITKDNPSGLPENNTSVRISVRFLNK